MLHEMLRLSKVKKSKSTRKVLIMDSFTIKIMSYSCKTSDISDAGILLVKDLLERREPMTSTVAIYFIQPLKENITKFLLDMSGMCPLYKKAYIYFSSPIPDELSIYTKNYPSVAPRIRALNEMNMEYFAMDSQGFVTDQEMALVELYGESAANTHNYSLCLNTMATRIATVFASMMELPYVRYRAAKSSSNATDDSSIDLIPYKLAAKVSNIISKYKTTILDFPQKETCDLLIVDRSIDLIAPVIHERTYDAMCRDLLNMDGNKCTYEVPSKSGPTTEKKEALLEDHDPIWLDIRHAHIEDVSPIIVGICDWRLAESDRDFSREMDSVWNKLFEKVELHIEVVSGKNKLRLLMICASVYPEEFEGDKGVKLMQLAKLTTEEMNIVSNLKYFGGLDTKKASGRNFPLKFDYQKYVPWIERADEDEMWQLSRFYPMIEELIEKLSKGELPTNEYPYMNEPTPIKQEGLNTSAPAQKGSNQAPHSMKSRPTPTLAKQCVSDAGNSSESADLKRMG